MAFRRIFNGKLKCWRKLSPDVLLEEVYITDNAVVVVNIVASEEALT